MCSVWWPAVRHVITSCSAISRCENPRASERSTSTSRVVNPAGHVRRRFGIRPAERSTASTAWPSSFPASLEGNMHLVSAEIALVAVTTMRGGLTVPRHVKDAAAGDPRVLLQLVHLDTRAQPVHRQRQAEPRGETVMSHQNLKSRGFAAFALSNRLQGKPAKANAWGAAGPECSTPVWHRSHA